MENIRCKRVSKICSRNIDRYITEDGYIKDSEGRQYMVKALRDRNVVISTINIGNKYYDINVTRLVAYFFVENPNMYNDVKHIDGNIENNHMSNLEWVPDAMQEAKIRGEKFKNVGCNDKYKISDHGTLISVYDKYIIMVNGNKTPMEHIVKKLKPKINKAGKGYYEVFIVCIDENGVKVTKAKLIHRLVAEAFIPNPENKPQVNHMDGNTLNAHVSNLEWVTPLENTRHAIRTGLTKQKGEDSSSAMITNETVKLIIQELLDGVSQLVIAKKYDISKDVVHKIANKTNRVHVWDKYFPNK